MLMHTSMCETIPLPSDETMDIPTPLAEKNHANSSTSARLDAPPPASSSSSSSATSSSSAALLLRDAINGTPSMSRNVGASIDASEISSSRNLSGTTTSEERQGRALIKVVDGDALSTSLSKLSLGTPLRGTYQSITAKNQQVRRFLTLNATRPTSTANGHKKSGAR